MSSRRQIVDIFKKTKRRNSFSFSTFVSGTMRKHKKDLKERWNFEFEPKEMFDYGNKFWNQHTRSNFQSPTLIKKDCDNASKCSLRSSPVPIKTKIFHLFKFFLLVEAIQSSLIILFWHTEEKRKIYFHPFKSCRWYCYKVCFWIQILKRGGFTCSFKRKTTVNTPTALLLFLSKLVWFEKENFFLST